MPFRLSLLSESFEKREIEQFSAIYIHSRKALVIGDNVLNRLSRDHGETGSKLAIYPARFLQLFDGIRSIVFAEKFNDSVLIFLVAIKIHSVRQPAHEVHYRFSVGTNEGASRQRAGDGVFKILLREVDENRISGFAGQEREGRLDDRRLNVSTGQRRPSFSLTSGTDDHDIFVWIYAQPPSGYARNKVRTCTSLTC